MLKTILGNKNGRAFRQWMVGAAGLAMAITAIFAVPVFAPADAAALRPAFFTGKWAAEEQLCTASSAVVEILPGHFKFGRVIDKTNSHVSYYQAKADLVEVGLRHPAFDAKIMFAKSDDGALLLKGADISRRELSAADWQRIAHMSNGTVNPASSEALISAIKSEVASSAARLERCSAHS